MKIRLVSVETAGAGFIALVFVHGLVASMVNGLVAVDANVDAISVEGLVFSQKQRLALRQMFLQLSLKLLVLWPSLRLLVW